MFLEEIHSFFNIRITRRIANAAIRKYTVRFLALAELDSYTMPVLFNEGRSSRRFLVVLIVLFFNAGFSATDNFAALFF